MKRDYPRSFCQFEFTQASDFVDLQPASLVSVKYDFGLSHSKSLVLVPFALFFKTLPSFNISTAKNMDL
ncbi:MAG: hypothetical protein FD181_622 [Prolixibacteraceae bacterium]|nr:MAG: hypothetical protein FD181_622 [Prolixibacteraceae bacterium]